LHEEASENNEKILNEYERGEEGVDFDYTLKKDPLLADTDRLEQDLRE
jgi:hypothetical protein